MSIFRSPVYLDQSLLVPIAGRYDIEVMVDVDLSERRKGSRGAGGSVGLRIPIPGTPSLDGRAERSTETEVTEQRVVRDNPVSAFNRLLDVLEAGGDVLTDVSDVHKRALVNLEEDDWELSPATDVGNLLAKMVNFVVANPTVIGADRPPVEMFSALASASEGLVVLHREGDETTSATAVLADSAHLLPGSSIDDLEGDRAVFGIVDTLVPEGREYSLERVVLGGLSRSIRRSLDTQQLFERVPPQFSGDADVSSLTIPGPLVVVKAVAIY